MPPPVTVNAGCGVPSTTGLKIIAGPLIARAADSDVPSNRATNPLPDQENRGCVGSDVVSTRPIQRTPSATTPAGGGTGLFASTVGAVSSPPPSGGVASFPP